MNNIFFLTIFFPNLFLQDAFADYFPEQGAALEDKLWKGLMYTAVGLASLATVVATR